MIDLHVHSTFSDGSLTPEELVRSAVEAQLTAMALTDHDCTSGAERFLAACRRTASEGYRGGEGLIGIPGVEISAEISLGTMHVIGYYVPPGQPGLETVLDRIRDGRAYRNQIILQRLNDLGLALGWEEVARFAGEDVVGRPHFALALLARGYVASKDEAFKRYLAKGQPAYADRFRLSPADSIAAIRAAGGLAVLAHPLTLELSRRALRDQVAELAAVGLDGIEVYYSEHTPEMVTQYQALAQEFDLVPTGGSDFHGSANPQISLGRGFGSLKVPDEIVPRLARRREARVS